MKIRFFSALLVLLFLTSCETTLEQPTSLLTQVIEFYKDLEQETAISFSSRSDVDPDETYVYFYPVEGATNFQLFQTSSDRKVPTNLSNYNLREFQLEDVFGGKLKRFVRNEREDVFCVITFQANGVFYQSKPVQVKNRTIGTREKTNITINQDQSLMPFFEWTDGLSDRLFHQLIVDENDTFLSGTFTQEKSFQYGNDSNVIQDVNDVTPPSLIVDDNYTITVFSIDKDFWVDNIYKRVFTAK